MDGVGIRLGIYSDNTDRGREKWVAEADYATFCTQLRSILSNPTYSRGDIRTQVTRLMGAIFSAETDRWVYEVCRVGTVIFGIPNEAEIAKLLAVLTL